MSDADAAVRLLKATHYESPRLRTDPYSEEVAINTVMNILSRCDTDTMAVITYVNGEAIGCMAAIMCPQLTSHALLASELLLYVMPDHRGSRAAYLMVRAFEEWAAPYDMRAGSALGVDDTKAINFYERLGYEAIGVGVMKRGSNNG